MYSSMQTVLLDFPFENFTDCTSKAGVERAAPTCSSRDRDAITLVRVSVSSLMAKHRRRCRSSDCQYNSHNRKSWASIAILPVSSIEKSAFLSPSSSPEISVMDLLPATC
jgi:hypothetical protein